MILLLCRTSGRGYRSATGAQAWASAQPASAARSAPLGLFSTRTTVGMRDGGESAPRTPIANRRGINRHTSKAPDSTFYSSIHAESELCSHRRLNATGCENCRRIQLQSHEWA